MWEIFAEVHHAKFSWQALHNYRAEFFVVMTCLLFGSSGLEHLYLVLALAPGAACDTQ